MDNTPQTVAASCQMLLHVNKLNAFTYNENNHMQFSEIIFECVESFSSLVECLVGHGSRMVDGV